MEDEDQELVNSGTEHPSSDDVLSPLNALERVPYRWFGEFGLTNEASALESIRQYVDDAKADGWSSRPTYSTESEDRAATLERDGFKMMTLARDDRDVKGRRYMFSAQISLYGPDGLTIPVPPLYNFDAIRTWLRKCPKCGAEDVDTVRYSFAGRCCAACLPEMIATHEKPGWNN